MKTQSQNNIILNHLRNGHTITAIEALGSYGCLRLAARVRDLQECGVKIKSQMVKVRTGKRVALYSLDNEA